MSNPTMLPSELNVTNINTSEIKSLGNGAKIMYLNYGESNVPIYIQTPEMELLWDASYYSESDDNGKYTCKLNFKGHESDPDIKVFLTKALEFDNHLIKQAVINSKKWFGGKSLSEDTIKELYTPMVKYSIDQETGNIKDEYPRSFSFKSIKHIVKIRLVIFIPFQLFHNQCINLTYWFLYLICNIRKIIRFQIMFLYICR